jgi:glycine oxidase
MRVRVIERSDLGAGATPVAAGILSPTEEDGWVGEFGAFNASAMSGWEEFASELSQASAHTIPYRRCGVLRVARDDSERARFECIARVLDEGAYQWLDERQCRELEPGLVEGLTGLLIPQEASVDTETLIPALVSACEHERKLVTISLDLEPTELLGSPERYQGVKLSDGSKQYAQTTVIAAGAWSGMMEWIPESLRPAVTPLFGEMVLLQGRSQFPLCTRVIRSVMGSVAPRDGDHYWAGTTVRDQGFDPSVSAGGIVDILTNHMRLLPDLRKAAIIRVAGAFRPNTPDDRPIIGEASPGLVYATGHRREGILHTPRTSAAVRDLVLGQTMPRDILAFSPQRFANTGT